MKYISFLHAIPYMSRQRNYSTPIAFKNGWYYVDCDPNGIYCFNSKQSYKIEFEDLDNTHNRHSFSLFLDKDEEVYAAIKLVPKMSHPTSEMRYFHLNGT